MALFSAAKTMDIIIGIDLHKVIIPPPLTPVPDIPHFYFGPIYLWHTPAFPKIDVFINGMPACATGAMGYYFHIPTFLPCPPSMFNVKYWKKKYLKNVVLGLLTSISMSVINMICNLIDTSSKGPTKCFMKDITPSTWEKIKNSFSDYTKWQTWVQLLMPPTPYPVGNGSTAVGSPNVTVNGGPLAIVGPLVATSCSELSVVPNAMTLGFSNVMVGVSFTDFIKELAKSMAQSAFSTLVEGKLEKINIFKPD